MFSSLLLFVIVIYHYYFFKYLNPIYLHLFCFFLLVILYKIKFFYHLLLLSNFYYLLLSYVKNYTFLFFYYYVNLWCFSLQAIYYKILYLHFYYLKSVEMIYVERKWLNQIPFASFFFSKEWFQTNKSIPDFSITLPKIKSNHCLSQSLTFQINCPISIIIIICKITSLIYIFYSNYFLLPYIILS